MDRNYCLIVFIVYRKKGGQHLKKKKKKGHHRVLFTRTCDQTLIKSLGGRTFCHSTKCLILYHFVLCTWCCFINHFRRLYIYINIQYTYIVGKYKIYLYELQKQAEQRAFGELFRPVSQRVQMILYLTTMYVYCVYPAM